ncbi:hypothetical protein LTR53_019226, partial [Teratosphaeriaceae sp. CCFEE 6253]
AEHVPALLQRLPAAAAEGAEEEGGDRGGQLGQEGQRRPDPARLDVQEPVPARRHLQQGHRVQGPRRQGRQVGVARVQHRLRPAEHQHPLVQPAFAQDARQQPERHARRPGPRGHGRWRRRRRRRRRIRQRAFCRRPRRDRHGCGPAAAAERLCQPGDGRLPGR